MIASFLVRLQVWGLADSWKRLLYLRCFPAIFMEVCRISFLQKISGLLLLISGNIADISLALSEINHLSHSWSRWKETFFVAEVNVTNKKSISSHRKVFFKKSVLIFLAKLTGQHLFRSLSLGRWRKIWFKKSCLMNFMFLEHLWTVASDFYSYLTALTNIYNFVENI